MDRFRRCLAMAGVTALLTGTALAGTTLAGAALAVPASAQPGLPLVCGASITQSVTLTANIGPCATSDGLVVTGSGITVNLNGFSIIGSHQNCPGTGCAAYTGGEQVGIQLTGASGDTVENGTVDYFDGGVVIQDGSGNTVTGIDAHDNINNDTLTTNDNGTCDNGDGIAVFSSDNNLIENNVTQHNGPYDGIAVVGIMQSGAFAPADNNTIMNNQSMDNYVADQDVNGASTLCGGSLNGADYFGMGRGRLVQDMGIRIEGPDAAYNTVSGNQVSNNGLDGIAIFDYFCNEHNNPTRGVIGHEPANSNNTIQGNTVTGTGDLAVQATSGQIDPSANGIAILSEGNPTADCTAYDNTIQNNTSDGNFQDGIWVGSAPSATGHPQDTTVINNVVDANSVDGIGVQMPSPNGLVQPSPINSLYANSGKGNGQFDGADYNFNPGCDSNTWSGNSFITVNQPCVADNGSGSVQSVVLTGSSGASGTGVGTLTTTWSDTVDVTNPAGFRVYSNSACSTLVGTGMSMSSGNGTESPVVTLTNAPAASTNDFFTIAASSVATSNGVVNAAVPCSAVSFGSMPDVAPSFTADSPPTSATVGSAYSYTFAASGNPAPSFSVSAGSLPAGLSLDTSTGVLSGTPSATGFSAFSVEATNSAGNVTSPSITINVVAAAPPPAPLSPLSCASGSTKVTGTVTHGVSVGAGSLCIFDATIEGSVSFDSTGSLQVLNSTIYSALSSKDASGVEVCDVLVGTSSTIADSTGNVVVGDGAGCAANSLDGSLSISGGSALVSVIGNTVVGSLSLSDNTDSSAVSDNVTITNNQVDTNLTCSGNAPGQTGTGNISYGKVSCRGVQVF